MKRRKWTNDQKLRIVLEGLRGQITVGELCSRHEIAQTQYYQWRGRLLNEGGKIFESISESKEVDRLKADVQELREVVGELTVELKKSEGLFA